MDRSSDLTEFTEELGADFNESHICIITNGARVFEEGSRRGYKRRNSPVEVGVLSKSWVGRGAAENPVTVEESLRVRKLHGPHVSSGERPPSVCP